MSLTLVGMWQENLGSFDRLLNHVRAYKALFWSMGSFVHSTGWLESLLCGHPRTRGGYTIPWMNYGMVNLLKQRLTSDLTLFEYGSGYSTLFYARLVCQVTSIECDREWFESLQAKRPTNVDLRFQMYVAGEDYCRAILATPECYDVVVVDGRDRVRCVEHSLERLTDVGIVILDDSQRPKYAQALEYLRHGGFKTLDIVGVKPGMATMCQTTIAYRDGNCLNL